MHLKRMTLRPTNYGQSSGPSQTATEQLIYPCRSIPAFHRLQTMSTLTKLTAFVARTQSDILCVCVFASLEYQQTESDLAITSRVPQLIGRTLFIVSKICIGEQGG